MLCWNGLQIWGFRVTLKMKKAFLLILCLPWASPSGTPSCHPNPSTKGWVYVSGDEQHCVGIDSSLGALLTLSRGPPHYAL